jgi:hypothetical protein
MNNKDFKHFVLLRSPNGRIRSHYRFDSYTDSEGNICEYHEGHIDPKSQQPVPVTFSFSRRHKVMPVNVKAKGKDRFGNPITKLEYLLGHPECEGSPNANEGQIAWFKLMDAEKDVDIALEANELRRKAESEAANLSGDLLKSAAALYNEVGGSVKKQKFAVLQWAFHDPEGFLKVVESPDFKVRGFIRRALAAGVLQKQGTIIRWGSVTIGIDEDDAIRKLLLDEDIMQSVKKLLGDKEAPEASIEEAVKKEIKKSKEKKED